VELQGVGALQIAFEKLKQKLAAEGLFAPERKRPLPEYPQRIGLVTSPTGAAIRDVLHVVQRRNPSLEIILVPCRVQGDGAAAEIVKAVRLLNEFQSKVTAGETTLDLILVTRGGGSLEDLWAFNEEIVARAIFESALPVVSAIGHEIDFTIADFVADMRAATPSAAAEIITEGVFASREFVGDAPDLLRRALRRGMDSAVENFDAIAGRLTRLHPRRRLDESLQRLDDLQSGLSRCTKQGVNERGVAWRNLATRLRQVRPKQLLKQRRESLKASQRRLRELARGQFKNCKSLLAAAESRLRLLGPEQVLSRGYSITTDAASGKVLRDAARIRSGQMLKTRLKKGEVFSEVQKKLR
jgi:exodeoxyribonuclease VII large subunit